MRLKSKVRGAAVALMFLGFPLLCGAQTSTDTVDTYISKNVGEADTLNSPTIKEWTTRHPGEVIEGPAGKGSDYDPANAWKLSPPQQQEMRLAGRWCLRSLAEIEFASGIHVRRLDIDSLRKDLETWDIRTEGPTRLGNEYYSGNLLEKVLKLAPEGAVKQLGHMATLDRRCHWDANSDSADCSKIIQEGEAFLTRFSENEWTPSVHLILAEAYAFTASNPDEEVSPTPPEIRAQLQKKAAAHYRAWYVKSENDRDRVLVWQEIWGLEAGMGPLLMMPFQFALAPY